MLGKFDSYLTRLADSCNHTNTFDCTLLITLLWVPSFGVLVRIARLAHSVVDPTLEWDWILFGTLDDPACVVAVTYITLRRM